MTRFSIDGIDEIDPRYPMDIDPLAEPTPFYDRLAREWAAVSPRFALAETRRSAHVDAATPVVRRYVTALPVTQPIPAITAAPPYQALSPASLARDDDITRRLRTLSGVPSPAGRRRGANGRYLPGGQ